MSPLSNRGCITVGYFRVAKYEARAALRTINVDSSPKPRIINRNVGPEDLRQTHVPPTLDIVSTIIIRNGHVDAEWSMVRNAPRNLGPCYARAPYVTNIIVTPYQTVDISP